MTEQRTTPREPRLTVEEVDFLRGLIVRHRTADAERWLLAKGFAPVQMRRVMMDQETVLVDAEKDLPLLSLGIGLGSTFMALLFGLSALAAAKDNSSFEAASGLDEFVYITEAFFIGIAVYCIARAIWKYVAYRRVRERYPEAQLDEAVHTSSRESSRAQQS